VFDFMEEQRKRNEELIKSFLPIYKGFPSLWEPYDPTASLRESMYSSNLGQELRGIYSFDPEIVRLPSMEFAEKAAELARNMGAPTAATVIGQSSMFDSSAHLSNVLGSGMLDFTKLASSLTDMNTTIAEAAQRSMLPTIDVPSFFDAMPDLGELYDRLTEEVGQEVLTEAGFEYLVRVVEVVAFADLAVVGDDKLEGEVGKRLADQTRSEEFRTALLDALIGSPTLVKRLSIVEAALEAHRASNDILAVPALLSQLEGSVADTLIVRKLAKREGKYLYELDPKTGQIKTRLSKDGKRQEKVTFSGLHATAGHEEWQNHSLVTALSSHITEKLSKERNKILHGINTEYADPVISARVLMAVYAYAQVLCTLEQRPPQS